MCVKIFPVNPTIYRRSHGPHGSHTQNTNPADDIADPVKLWFFFINYLYINKVYDVCDNRQSPIRKGLRPHSLAASIVRQSCTWVKSILPLHEVECLIYF